MIKGVAETCLYAENLDEAERFYTEILGLKLVLKEESRHLFFRCGDDMVLIFNPHHTKNQQTEVEGNPVPLHGATGPVHVAFSVAKEDYTAMKDSLQNYGVAIESEISWPNSSRSFYFRDPANNSLEILTEDMWNF